MTRDREMTDNIRRLNVGLGDITFDRTDTMLIFEFFSRFIIEANTIKDRKAQVFVD